MDIHFPTSVITSMKRGEVFVEASTGCGEKVAKVMPRGGSLIDVGVSGWSTDITCAGCRKRLKIEGDS